jgi:alkanesulfonate monooxygenase SsuD/methylene tetrahydromethanopterin reductase-like flavin-dependent oxidoreductase (luciferase family)
MEKLGITIPTLTASLDRIPQYAALAEAGGLHSTWVYELYRNPFAMLCTSAMATEHVELATGIAAAFTRSPFELANAAADIDELSGGRMRLGLGIGAPELLQAFHSTNASAAIGRVREYVEAVRRSWLYLAGEHADPFTGRHYQLLPIPVNPWGLRTMARPCIPIHLGAMRPQMLSLAGEIADGWIGYLATPRFIEEDIIPGLEAGARKAGRDVSDVEMALEVVCSVSPDRDVAMHRARLQVGFYLAHPVSDVVVERHGLQTEQAALRQALISHGLEGLAQTDDRLVETFSITGTPEEARQKLSQYREIPHIILHTPYLPVIGAEGSEDAYQQIISAFGAIAADLSAQTTGIPAA